jgi:hypothetical protein
MKKPEGFVCDGTCAGNELGDCNHGEPNDGLQHAPSDDDEVRGMFVALIVFIAQAKASNGSKNKALDAVQKLQARLLP